MKDSDKLKALEERLKKQGVLDVKFHFDPGPRKRLDKLAREVVDVLEDVLEGRTSKLELPKDYQLNREAVLKEKLERDMCNVLEAVLDGKTKPLPPLGDSQRLDKASVS